MKVCLSWLEKVKSLEAAVSDRRKAIVNSKSFLEDSEKLQAIQDKRVGLAIQKMNQDLDEEDLWCREGCSRFLWN